MRKKISKRKSTVLVEVLVGLIIVTLFLLLLVKYYSPASESTPKELKLNPRFAIIDTQLLEKEANSLIISHPSPNEKATNVFVLTYHVVSPNPPKDDYEISYDQFKNNMFALKSHGYQTISLEDFNAFLGGKKELPDKSFLITFDDGAKAAYYNADPVLKALNYTAVMFVITGQSLEDKTSPYYLTEKELISAQQTGRWELESHTHNAHFRLPINIQGNIAPALTNKIWISEEKRIETDQEFQIRVNQDLEKSKVLLETKFNKTVIAFALPYGDFGERGSNYGNANYIVRNWTTSNFKLIFYEYPIRGLLYKGNYPDNNQDYHIVGRLAADIFRTPESLLNRIESTSSISLPYVEDYSNNDRWPRLSGIAAFENDFITLKTNSDLLEQTILMAYLDGSYLLEDYTFSIQLVNNQTSTISLISRLTVKGDYVACQYKNNKITLVKKNSGVQEKVKSVLIPETISLKEGTRLSMSVRGQNVKCSIKGKNILNANVPDISPHGGVAIKMEDYTMGNGTFSYGNISIMPI